MSLYGTLYGSPLGSSGQRSLFPSQWDAQQAQWVMQTHQAMRNQLSSDYQRQMNLNALTAPPWIVDAERAQYRAKAYAAGGDQAYSRDLDRRIAAARDALGKP